MELLSALERLTVWVAIVSRQRTITSFGTNFKMAATQHTSTPITGSRMTQVIVSARNGTAGEQSKKQTKINVSLKVNQTFSCGALTLIYQASLENIDTNTAHYRGRRKARPCVSERIPTSSLFFLRAQVCAGRGRSGTQEPRAGSVKRNEAINKSLNNKLKNENSLTSQSWTLSVVGWFAWFGFFLSFSLAMFCSTRETVSSSKQQVEIRSTLVRG